MRRKRPRRTNRGPSGFRLFGMPEQPGPDLRNRIRLLLVALLITTNLTGTLIVAALLAFVLPGPNLLTEDYAVLWYTVVPVFVALATGIGFSWCTTIAERALRWLREDRIPTHAEGSAALALPLRLTLIQASLWACAVIAFGVVMLVVDPTAVPKLVLTVAFAGIVVGAFNYLLTELALRPISARVLDTDTRPRHRSLTGLTGRATLAWVLGSAIPVAGLMLVALFGLRNPITTGQLIDSILSLGGITLVVGGLLTQVDTRRSVDPVHSVIDAMSHLTHGDDDPPRVTVYDGSELGELQSGFNRMADGLAERNRIRELFGRHVGREVAAEALRDDPELGGTERVVAVLFIDLVGSTGIAATRPPHEVVELLNRFFEVVVDEVDRHRGIVNKFVGDEVMAVYGAPLSITDPAGQALATARTIDRRLRTDVPDCTAGIGVAYGVVVAGYLGARERFEYTVIGDPVNEAARLCELAKTRPGRLLVSDKALAAAADETETRYWVPGETVTLRGRVAPTRLIEPASG
ncbi:adenylate/guanylate cyclase domain-containing protein [Skermania piniformis]|uniref:Adenylate/guanylate cyclase domain-containing protein n=1 Tax=Skermania pinensis TaxID=39122 RepID=A0ABX8SEV2_9ACTN|nr:adenylate/guanylate cyclase domain-containing protein [Skermania piniformis]